MNLADRLAGGVWGHLLGDAIGVPYEGRWPAAIPRVVMTGYASHRQPPGTWSDDGALMLALLDSLLRPLGPDEARFDTADQARRFLAWADARTYTPDGDAPFDIGHTTALAFRRLRDGASPEAAGGGDERDNGNGSLMRILPLALVERDIDEPTLVEHAHRQSAITHAHPLAQAACALYVLVVRRLLAGVEPAEALPGARRVLRSIYSDGLDADLRLAVLDTLEAGPRRPGSGYVVDTFWTAWEAFTEAGSYRTAIERAVGYGHDTDTTAATAGGLAGVRWGLAGIPNEWRYRLRGESIVAPLVAQLLEGLEPRPA